jgi:hypothetical protein
MTCTHLRQLYQLCQQHDLKLGSSDVIRLVCNECGEQDVCPSTLMTEYDARHPDRTGDDAPSGTPPASSQTGTE